MRSTTSYFVLLLMLALFSVVIMSCGSGSTGTTNSVVTTWSDGLSSNRITGSVVDQMGQPVSDVAIYFSQFKTSTINYSDSNGNFTIINYPLGSHEVRFEKLGYVGTSVRAVLKVAENNLGTVKIVFGDADVNGLVNQSDINTFEAMLGISLDNTNRFMDYDHNYRMDSIDLTAVLQGGGNKGLPASEWLASKPDYVTYVPALSSYQLFTTNQHYIVTQLKNGRLLGIWTGGFVESADNQSMLCHWSDNGGKTWSDFNIIDGPWWEENKIASWGFPIYVPEQNRFYVFYNKDIGTRIYQQGHLAMKYSDDGGVTWSREYKYAFAPGEFTPKNTDKPPYWWVYQRPLRIGNSFIVGFTEILPHEPDIYFATEVRFLSFDNIVSSKDPASLVISTFPENGKPGLRGAYTTGTNQSTLQEPSIVQLSDGRLFCVMRSGGGSPYFSLSSDNGKTWTPPSKLRYGDGGVALDQPLASCPIYKLSDSRYVLVFHNNPGTANGGLHTGDGSKNRTPAFIVYAREDLSKNQPLTFSAPIRFLENYVRPYGPQNRTEIGTYPSLTEVDGIPVLWYPDRKHYLLGKRLPKTE